MTWETFAFLLVAGAAFGYSGYRVSILWRLLAASKGPAPAFKDIPARITTTIANVLGQKAVLRKRGAGLIHALIFWGFIIITTGTLEQFATTLYRPANFEFIGEIPYRALLLLQDVFTVLVLAAVGAAAFRRTVVRPPHLMLSRDAMVILALTGSLMVSILLMNAFRILGDHPWWQIALPFSRALSSLLAGLDLSPETAAAFGTAFKWVHMLIVLGFAAYIPGSKHLHILAAGPNTFLRNLPVEKPMRPIAFEDESITQYGASKVTELSWKDTLDYYSCTECGRCQELCPAWNTGKPLSPMMLVHDLKENLFRNKEAILAGKPDEVTPAIDQNVTEPVIWACTSCRACETACPVFINHTDKIYEVRRNLVMMESKFPQEVQTVFKNMETNATPWAFSAADRAHWADGLGVRTAAENPGAEVLLWVGCAGSYDDRNKKVVRAFVSLLRKAGINFSILGTEEKCTGDPARRIGNEYLFQTLAKENVETLNRHKVKTIVTACPHCFNTLKNEYGAFGGHYEVFHHSQFIARLIREGRLRPTKALDETVTFHDSCYLGRWNGVYDDPRSAVAAIPATRMVEMKSSREKSMCCGAGGGRMWMEETIGRRVNVTRTEQAIETRAGIIASACPFCMTMMSDGVKNKEMQEKVRVVDVAELVDQATP